MKRLGHILGAILLAVAGCVTSSQIQHGKDGKWASLPLAPTTEPVTDRDITAENANAVAQALMDELDREEKQIAAETTKDTKAFKH